MKQYIITENQFPLKIDQDIFMSDNYFFNVLLVKGKEKSAVFKVGISEVVDTAITRSEGL